MTEDSPIIIALDFSDAKSANSFLDQIQDQSCKLKVGLELFISEGPGYVEKLAAQGHQVFLDLKLHDIPNTVAMACKSISNLGIWMTTLHASGGLDMLQAAHEAMSESENSIKLAAVTVLTSLGEQQLNSIGVKHSAAEQVLQLADVAMQAHMDGIVCSVHETEPVRDKWGNDPIIVTPGIRMQEDDRDDQSRVATPQRARQSGSTYIVVGRPITQANDPILTMHQYFNNWSSSNP